MKKLELTRHMSRIHFCAQNVMIDLNYKDSNNAIRDRLLEMKKEMDTVYASALSCDDSRLTLEDL